MPSGLNATEHTRSVCPFSVARCFPDRTSQSLITDALAAASEQLINGALIRWLDSVMSIEQVQVSADDATLTIRVSYTRRDTGEQQVDAFSTPIPG